MSLKKIKDNYFENLKMNKYDFFNRDKLRNFLIEYNKKEKKYILSKTNLEKFIINILKNKIEIDYANIELEYHDGRGVVGFQYKEKLEKSDVALLKYKNINDLKEERCRNSRDEMNVEIISKENFLKELEIIVDAYKNIYNDNEVQEMFENFKENL